MLNAFLAGLVSIVLFSMLFVFAEIVLRIWEKTEKHKEPKISRKSTKNNLISFEDRKYDCYRSNEFIKKYKDIEKVTFDLEKDLT